MVSSFILDTLAFYDAPDESIIYDRDNSANAINTMTPQLWSHHKILEINASQCAIAGKSALTLLKFTAIVKKDNYVYGNLLGNRAAIKCVALGDEAFVYIAVAGDNANTVEQLRNQISWQF